jgi:alpha(1,3/1,4) fucosyltransferase
MKKIIVIPFSEVFKNNKIFDLSYGNDNRSLPYFKLREKLINNGFEVNTYDKVDLRQVDQGDILLSFNHQKIPFNYLSKRIEFKNRILIAQEPLSKLNFKGSILMLYGKTLTWNENIIDDKSVIRIKAYPVTKINVDWIPVEKRKFLTNISINKTSNNKGELYSERLKTILLAEKYFPGEFDHYGIGWNSPTTLLQKIGLKKYHVITSYKGPLNEKYETLKQYKFSVCYENTKFLRGNISEKIFDCFQCGVIPLYWGAPDILKYIPAETFIHRENFNSNEEMLLFIRSLSGNEISSMISSIQKFINSDIMADFWDDTYVERIVNVIQSLPA